MSRPPEIAAWTALRGLAALWVVLFHFWPQTAAPVPLLVARGYLAVDLFFCLSGAVMMLVYAPLIRGGDFGPNSCNHLRKARQARQGNAQPSARAVDSPTEICSVRAMARRRFASTRNGGAARNDASGVSARAIRRTETRGRVQPVVCRCGAETKGASYYYCEHHGAPPPLPEKFCEFSRLDQLRCAQAPGARHAAQHHVDVR